MEPSQAGPSETEEILTQTIHRLERLYLALDSAYLGQWELIPDEGSITRSQRYDELFGYPSDYRTFKFLDFLNCVLEEDRDEVRSSFETALESHAPWVTEFRIRRSDGQVRWLWKTAKVQPDDETGILRVVGIAGDITDSKALRKPFAKASRRFEHWRMTFRNLRG